MKADGTDVISCTNGRQRRSGAHATYSGDVAQGWKHVRHEPLQLPDGGMTYRPETNDLLVTEEDGGHIVSVNASTGAISLFADVTTRGVSDGGHWLYELAINSANRIHL